ncbi:MAG: site-specific integrase, partial [Rhodospirillaceae bacterium]|nr:site-specific integrase [Rhodospirillaceae bacterium]
MRSLKWDYVDQKMQVLKLPDSKTGAKYVYVGNTVMNLLDEIRDHPTRPTDNPYVIWGLIEDSHLDNVQKPWRRFRKLAGIEDVRIHDLRHSFASFAVSKGMSLAMIGRLLGHSQVQTTARYAHLMAGPMTEAASSVTDVLG